MDCIEIERQVASQVTLQRFNHCKSTAMQALELLKRYQAPFSLKPGALVAGLWHDIAREWPDEDLLSFSLSHALSAQTIEIDQPMLLHGAVAAALLPSFYLQANKETLLAIRWHTLGSPDMGLLGAVLYISDYLEPLRTHITPAERADLLKKPSIAQLCLSVAQKHLSHIRERDKTPAESTISLIAYLEDGGQFN